ncbi:MAG: universal stress protein [Balneolaceae bacterium]
MGDLKKWLIATNGTKYASAAVKYAAELYKDLRFEPEVCILVVAVDEEAETEAKAIMEMAKYMFEDEIGKEVNLTTLVAIGEPGKVIVEQMASQKSNHLFIGGADFKWDINDKDSGGISNYIIHNLTGGVTVIK